MYTNLKYGADSQGNNICILCDVNSVNGVVPIDNENSDYAEIMRQVEAGDLTIQDAD